VRLQITTDGQAVTAVATKDGHPLLIKAATDSAQTWKFIDHVPGTFEVTFTFRFLQNKVTFLQQPGVVDVAVVPPVNTESHLAFTFPTWWNAQLKGPKGNIRAPLSLWTYGPWLRGYTLGPANQQRAIRYTRRDENMLGFDATLDDSHGQRLKFFLIGRKEGDAIKGIFLDDWGASGAWTAASSTPPLSSNCPEPTEKALENTIAVPEIIDHRQPEYPWLPFEAKIEGSVRLRVTADTSCVATVVRESGNPLLADAAQANVRTWRFDYHPPGTFEVTFNYRMLESRVIFLEEPGLVEVFDEVPQINIDNVAIYSSSDTWKMHLSSIRGNIEATLSLVDSYYASESSSIESRGKKEPIREYHQDGDILGFDATLYADDGKPVKVALLGKRTGNRIKGIFLDYSGTPGTWNAQFIPASDAP